MIHKTRLLTPGPTPIPEEVRLALARDMIHHRKSEFTECMGRVLEGLKYLFQTTQPVLPLSCSGTGAMTAAVTNLFAPGEKVLVVEGGKFGERWSEIADSHGLEIVAVPIAWGQAVQPKHIEGSLENWPDIRGVLVQASETSTGVRHPIGALGKLLQKRDVMLVVDGISAVGVSPCPMDEWHIDCLVTGSQKGLMLPPGLGFIALSQRAWTRVETVKPKNFYFNMLKEREKSLARQTLYTSPVNLIMGLEASLHSFRSTGLKEVFRKQWALTCMARAGVQEMGLALLARDNFTWGLTSVSLPPGIDGAALLDVCARDYGVIMAGGQGRLKGRIVRIGHMGHVDYADLFAGLHALQRSFVKCGGVIGSRDYLERAAQAYEDGLETFDQDRSHV
ncbi:MAG: pyridoxal-phosphate-dependent aminotransferase family protein [Desulfovibrionales bacterium]